MACRERLQNVLEIAMFAQRKQAACSDEELLVAAHGYNCALKKARTHSNTCAACLEERWAVEGEPNQQEESPMICDWAREAVSSEAEFVDILAEKPPLRIAVVITERLAERRRRVLSHMQTCRVCTWHLHYRSQQRKTGRAA